MSTKGKHSIARGFVRIFVLRRNANIAHERGDAPATFRNMPEEDENAPVAVAPVMIFGNLCVSGSACSSRAYGGGDREMVALKKRGRFVGMGRLGSNRVRRCRASFAGFPVPR